MTDEPQTLGDMFDQILIDPPGNAHRRKCPVRGHDTVIFPTITFLDEPATVRGARLDQVGNAAQRLPFFAG